MTRRPAIKTPAWVYDEVMILMRKYPEALRLCMPRDGSPPKRASTARESIKQRHAMIRELMEVYPHQNELAAVLGVNRETIKKSVFKQRISARSYSNDRKTSGPNLCDRVRSGVFSDANK